MHKRNASNQLPEHIFASCFGQPCLLAVMVEGHALAQLHHKVNLRPLVDHFQQSDYVVRPDNSFHVDDFIVHRALGLPILEVLLVVGFESAQGLRIFVRNATNVREGTLPDFEFDLKLSELKGRNSWLRKLSLVNKIVKSLLA